MALFGESGFFGLVTDSSSNVASSSSTPPTTVADSASLHSDTSKHDLIIVAEEPLNDDALLDGPPLANTDLPTESGSPRRPRRSAVAAPVYNLSKLSGTDGHGKRRANGDVVSDRRRRTISGDTLVGSIEVAAHGGAPKATKAGKAASKAIDALDLSSPRTRRQARLSLSPRSQRTSTSRRPVVQSRISSLGSKLSSLGKRGRKAADTGISRMSRELMRLQDTKEFAHVDDKPVVHTVWSNGKFIDPNEPAPPPRKKTKVPEPEPEPEKEKEAEPVSKIKQRRVKKYLGRGLYAGQDGPADVFKGLSVAEKKQLASIPELLPSGRINKIMPSPMYTGLRLLLAGRDFKLPYQVCNPLPPGQPKPEEWKKMTKNRFIGDSKEYWRNTPHFIDQSTCVCTPDDGCGESCQNRIMLYECDSGNCNVGPANCQNRAFADLTARRIKGGKYRVGVDVIKTSDRGYGVRSNRCFRANQIIMEYTGEIITEEECERRMNEVYKDNECYYLMSFDQNMIIDATTGSSARFVNHSCNPNCRMIKWIVSGKPRMALFAGDRPIMTGDELTYDYNFDPFSAKNVQRCLCNEPNCRGVLGPKPREVKPPKTNLKKAVKATVKAGKRKLKELIGDGDDAAAGKAAKKRKIQPATGAKRSISTAGKKAAKGAATALKKGMATIAGNAKKAAKGTKSPVKRRIKTGAIVKTTTAKKVTKTYKSATARVKEVSSHSSSTIVALGDENSKPGKGKKSPPAKGKKDASAKKASTTTKKAAAIKKISTVKKTSTIKKTSATKKSKPIARKAGPSKRGSPLSTGPRKSGIKQKVQRKINDGDKAKTAA